MKVDTQLTDRELTRRLMDVGIRVRTLSSYYHEQDHPDTHCLVVNYASLREEKLEEALTRLDGVFG